MSERSSSSAAGPFLAKLKDVKAAGESKWMARCPAHDDDHPSLSIGIGADGRVLLKCHAGCRVDAVLAELGLCKADLFAPTVGSNGQQATSPRKRTPRGSPRLYPSITSAAAGSLKDRRVTTVYRYTRDFAVVRFVPKAFRPYHRIGNEWACGDPPSPLPLFGLDSIKDDGPIVIVEGEKDVEVAHLLGHAAVTNAHGADAVGKTDWSPVAGKSVVVVPDNDDAGRKHAEAVLAALGKLDRVPTVHRLELPDLAEKGDLTNWVEAHDSRETADLSAMLTELIREAPVVEVVSDQGNTEPTAPPADAGNSSRGPSQATLLVNLCDDIDLFHDERAGFARVCREGHFENWALRSRDFKIWLSRKFYLEHSKTPGGQAMNDALTSIEGRAQHEGPEQETCIRVGAHDGSTFLDLCDRTWQAVQIDGTGWRVVASESVPMRFIRRRGMRTLPEPRHGGSVDDLRKFVNLPDDDTWTLFVGWLVAALAPRGPYPVLVVNGEQGSAKSTLCRFAREIVDPSRALLRRPPKDERELLVAALNGHVLAFDNLSGLPPFLSDSLCAMATGAGFVARQLYTDDEERAFYGARPILLNGIADIATRPDLLDRSLSIVLPAIDPSRRREEARLLVEFEAARPCILGGLLNAAAAAIGNLPGVELAELPRMADFARLMTAAEPGLNWSAGRFMDAYDKNREDHNAIAVEASAIGKPILDLMRSRREWVGAPDELLTALSDGVDKRTRESKTWPRTPRGLNAPLQRITPNLRALGIVIDNLPKSHDGRRIRITWIEPSQPSLRHKAPLAGAPVRIPV